VLPVVGEGGLQRMPSCIQEPRSECCIGLK
jgi:hypothetical protein